MGNQREFPRSRLFRLIRKHPLATAATVVATLYIGPRRIGRMGLAGLQAANRHATMLMPVLEQVATLRRR